MKVSLKRELGHRVLGKQERNLTYFAYVEFKMTPKERLQKDSYQVPCGSCLPAACPPPPTQGSRAFTEWR